MSVSHLTLYLCNYIHIQTEKCVNWLLRLIIGCNFQYFLSKFIYILLAVNGDQLFCLSLFDIQPPLERCIFCVSDITSNAFKNSY